MSVPKPPFHSTLEEILYNIYLKLPEMGSLTTNDIDTLAKLNAILTDGDLLKAEDIVNAIEAIKGNVPVVANTLEKLHNIILGLNYLKAEDLDTLAELNAVLSDADLIRDTDLSNAINALKGNVPATADTLEKLYALVLEGTKKRIISFQFESNLFTEDSILFRGKINTLSQDITEELLSVSYESRLDTVDVWTPHADLAALQAWITANVNGNEATGQKFWIKSIATYKLNKTGEAENVFSYTVL